MNIGGISGALVKAQAENHVSLASLNVDFSLLRVQPPNEYLAVGNLLSAQRKEEADAGQPHATATMLGLLFDSLIPAVPRLIHAYGLRCSEIAQSPLFNPKGGKEHGLFATQVGADGTSIWAAATSGKSAIAVHLLACMLATVWDSPKAISIWMELISTRKKELESSENPLGLSVSRVELRREQIASWDASARSWCLTADQANERRQKQLRLIIDHLGLPISPKFELSASVIDAWQTALIMVDRLVGGEPQSAHSGAPLLGLASWHLYPDLVVFGKGRETKDVKQQDPLIHPGGILTLGIHDTRRSGQGIYWSLPLANLRYYGDPVICEASLHSSTSRVAIEQLMFVAFGSLIRRWLADVDDIVPAAELCLEMCHYCTPWDFGKPYATWLSLFAHLAGILVDSTGEQRADILRLVKCGRRKYPQFIDHPWTHSILGLSDCRSFLGLIPSNARRARLLQEVAKDFVVHDEAKSDGNHLMVIQCRESPRHPWQVFTAVKLESIGTHVRWLTDRKLPFESGIHDAKLSKAIPWFGPSAISSWTDPPIEFYAFFLQGHFPENLWTGARGASVTTTFLLGDIHVAALYSISISTWRLSPNHDIAVFRNQQVRILPNIFILRHITIAVRLQLPARDQMLNHLQGLNVSKKRDDSESSQSLAISLKALVTLWAVYKNLPGATVELKAASQPLSTHQWVPGALGSRRNQYESTMDTFYLSMEHTFACIAKFESGNFNFQPSAMKGTLAISSGNSLYVARCLLQDPCEKTSSSLIARVVGTVGKSGMALLIPPQLPRVRRAAENYALVNHDMFDGTLTDCFQSTTLHLSFTEWRLAIDVGSRGNRDVEAHYVETAVGVYDRGEWVADVNVMDIFSHDLSNIMPECVVRHESHLRHEDLGKLVAIDNWDELIDNPPEAAVVRTRGNWQARLAAAALSIQRGHETRVLSDKICWTCCAQSSPSLRSTAHIGNESVDHAYIGPFSEQDRKHGYDEDSDSDLDDVVKQELERSKRRKVYEDYDQQVELEEADERPRNLVYIL